MDAKEIESKEIVPASRKLGKQDAAAFAKAASKVYVAKGKKLDVFDMKTAPLAEVVEKMLGPTGNLRAPTMRVGRTTVVGFSEETFDSVLG